MLQITDILINVHKRIRNEQEQDYGTVLELDYRGKDRYTLNNTHTPVLIQMGMQVTYINTTVFQSFSEH